MKKMEENKKTEKDFEPYDLMRLRPNVRKDLDEKIHEFRTKNTGEPQVIIMNKYYYLITCDGLQFFCGCRVYFSNAVAGIEVF